MKHTIRYTLNISIDALMKSFSSIKWMEGKHIYDDEGFWDINPGIFDEEENYISIIYPNKKHPKLTRALFFKIMCSALPLSHHGDTGFHVEAFADDEEKKMRAVHFTDSYLPRCNDNYNGEFWYKGEVFSQALEEKLNAIRRIVNNDH